MKNPEYVMTDEQRYHKMNKLVSEAMGLCKYPLIDNCQHPDFQIEQHLRQANVLIHSEWRDALDKNGHICECPRCK